MNARLITLIAFSLASFVANGQLIKGRVLIGTSTDLNNGASFYTNLDKNSDSRGFQLSSFIGYFFADRFMAGGNISFYTGRYKDNLASMLDVKYSGYSLGPELRFYLTRKGKARPFADILYSFGHGKAKINDSNGKHTEYDTSHGYNIKLGADFFLNSRIAIEAAVGYVGNKSKSQNGGSFQDSIDKTNSFNLSLGFAILL